MRRLITIVSSPITSISVTSCKDTVNMKSLPTTYDMDCSPYGTLTVHIDAVEEDGLDYNIDAAHQAVLKNWKSIWSDTYPKIEGLLEDYEYGHSMSELLESPTNTIRVLITPPYEDEDYRLDVSLDVDKERGSHAFGVFFSELEAEEASATF